MFSSKFCFKFALVTNIEKKTFSFIYDKKAGNIHFQNYVPVFYVVVIILLASGPNKNKNVGHMVSQIKYEKIISTYIKFLINNIFIYTI